MLARTLTIRADLAERLETLAADQDQSIDEVLENLLPPASSENNWVMAVAEGMAAADIDWRDEPDAVERSREHFEQHLREKWQRMEGDNNEKTDAQDSR